MEQRRAVSSSFVAFDQRFRVESPDPSLAARVCELYGDLHLELDPPGPMPTLTIVTEGPTGGGWRIERDGRSLKEGSDPSRVIDKLVWAVNRIVFREIAKDELILHAGAVAAADGSTVMALCGASNHGKSTLTLELVRRGYPYLTDEALQMQADGMTRGFAKPVSIKRGSFPLFPDLAELPANDEIIRGPRQWHLRASAIGSTVQGAPIGVMVFPRYEPDAGVQLRSLGPAASVARAARSSFSPEGGRVRLDQVRPLASALVDIDAVELVFDDLHEAADTLEGLLQR